jgi:hypothetical protein
MEAKYNQTQEIIFFIIIYTNAIFWFFFFLIIVLLEVYCDIYKSSYNISWLNSPPPLDILNVIC